MVLPGVPGRGLRQAEEDGDADGGGGGDARRGEDGGREAGQPGGHVAIDPQRGQGSKDEARQEFWLYADCCHFSASL